MQFENEKFVENEYGLTFTKELTNLKCLVEEEEDQESEMTKDPAFQEIKESLMNALKQSFMGQLEGSDEDEEDEEEEGEEEEDETEEDEDNGPSEDNENPENPDENEAGSLIPEVKLLYLTQKEDPEQHLGIMLMEEGVALGDIIDFDESEPKIQFQHFGFQTNNGAVELPAKAKIGIFSESQLQNIITLEAAGTLYHKFGERLVIIEGDRAILFNGSPIFFEPKNPHVKDYFDDKETASIKKNKLSLMIKTF